MPDFDDRMMRSFHGDLDAVERRALERELEDLAKRARFDAAWDARVEAAGFLAFDAPEPDLNECFSLATLQRYAGGELDSVDAALVQAHADCPLCGVQLTALERSQGVADIAEEPAWRRWIRVLLQPAPLLVLATVIIVGVWMGSRPGPDDIEPGQFTARGTSAEWSKLVGVDYLADKRPLGAEIASGAAVSVTVRNRRDDKGVFLMVFGVNAAGEVDWYYPPWTDPAANPTSILVARGETQLPEAVAFDRPRGSYRLVAWFTERPTDVRAIEAKTADWLRAHSVGHPEPIELGEGHQTTRRLAVP